MRGSTQPREVQCARFGRGFSAVLGPEVSVPDMIGVMELPREDLLECRRRGDYQRYAWSLAGARASDDDMVKLTYIRRLGGDPKSLDGILDLGAKVPNRGKFPSLVILAREEGEDDETLARIFELGHLRDLVEAISLLGSTVALGDLPDGGGLLQARLAAVAIYDLSLVDGIVAWVENDPSLEEQAGEPEPKGRTSAWNKAATRRGSRLWELRKRITQDYSGKDPYEVNEKTSDVYVWAHHVGAKQAVLSRVAHLASWSPSRRAFTDSKLLRPALETRPGDVLARDRLVEYWEVLRQGALLMKQRGRNLDQISEALRVHANTIEEWLADTHRGTR